MPSKKEIQKKILAELVNNPQVTNKEMSALVGVSQPTVARYRKELEDDGLVKYFAYINNTSSGTGAFGARKLYLIYFTQGITRKQVAAVAFSEIHKKFFYNKHVFAAHLGDDDGRVVLVFVLESRVRGDFVDILNGEIVPSLRSHLGTDCIDSITGIDLEETLRILHNYEGAMLKVAQKDTIYVTDILD